MQKPLPSTSLETAVRTYLGLTQEQLACYLGISRGQVAHAEAGRRVLSGEASRRLFLLAALLPAPLGQGPGEPAAESASSSELLDPALLRRRLRRCTQRAANLRLELSQLDARVQLARRWQQLLPSLRQTLADDSGPVPPLSRQWLLDCAADAGTALAPNQATPAVGFAHRAPGSGSRSA
jgi:transcriptional regulator with XRE-family HTH domain